ncbi:MAG: hypothetical protein H7289_08065 [Mucilaginibacter sp.]|nr:hypothetical protein [Mucilaginibacter sp.]
MQRKFNTWYTVKDGNWDDPNTWLSNGLDKRSNTCPQPGDDVHVDHVVTLNISTIAINNIYISGTLLGSSTAVNITVNGNCQVSGSGLINLPTNFHNLILKGYVNIIPYANFNAGNYSTVTYAGISPQPIINIPYRNLATSGSPKYQVDNITTLGSFNMQSDYDIGNYSLTVGGNSVIGVVGSFTLSKSGTSGSILFIGNVDFEGGTDLSVGNPNMEFRGGLTIHTFKFTSGTGTVTFSTNNQTINSSAYLGGVWNSPIIVSGAIIVTVAGSFSTHSTINGTASASTLNNDGTLILYNPTLPMSTGLFEYMHDTNSTLGLFYDGNYTLPYTNYANLTIGGNGIKTQAGNTLINKSLNIGFNNDNLASNIYECNGYNLNVKGSFTNRGGFKANSYSTITFEGPASFLNGSNASLGVDLSLGNPDVEFRNGLLLYAYVTNTGTGTYKFAVNNQTIDFTINNSGTLNCNILISGPITVTYINGVTGGAFAIFGIIDGDSTTSTLINKGMLSYSNAQQPMQTGLLNASGFTNTFIYAKSGGQDITSGNYKNLILQGSGAKKLLGNVSVANTYTLTSPATLNSNGFALSNP